jgi:hypothetical protein
VSAPPDKKQRSSGRLVAKVRKSDDEEIRVRLFLEGRGRVDFRQVSPWASGQTFGAAEKGFSIRTDSLPAFREAVLAVEEEARKLGLINRERI